MTEGVLDQRLRDLVAAQLVTEESAEQFAFRHALMHEAVYRTLLVRERKRVHHVIAETIERLYADALDGHAAELAHHYFEAGTWQKALTYSQQAGERAQQMYAPREAIAYFTRALESGRQLAAGDGPDPQAGAIRAASLHRARGQAYDTLGDFERAQGDYEMALQLARQSDERRAEWQALLDLGFLWAARDYQRTGAYFERALDLARALEDPAMLAHTLNRVGNWHGNIGRLHRAVAYHRDALALFEGLRDLRGSAETLDLLGLVNFQIGDTYQSDAYYQRAIRLFRELGDRQGLSSALSTYAERVVADNVYSPTATVTQALSEAAEALQLAREIGWRSGEAYALLIQAMLLDICGQYGRAFESAQQGTAIAEEIAHGQWLALAHWVKGWLYRDVLALEEALQHAERGLQFAQEVGSLLLGQMIRAELASIRMLRNDWPGVEHIFASAWHSAPGQTPAGGSSPMGPSGEAGPPPDPEGLQDFRTAVPAAGSGEPAGVGEPEFSMFAWWLLATQGERLLAEGDPAQALVVAEHLNALALRPSHRTHGVPPPQVALLRAGALVQLDPPPSADDLQAAQEALQAVGDNLLARGVRSGLWRVHIARGKLYRAQGQPEAAGTEFAAARALVDELAGNIPPGQLRSQFRERALAQIEPARG